MPEGGNMDIKWIVILALVTGGTNALQFLGITQPTQRTETDTTMAAEMISAELQRCYDRLSECMDNCGGNTSWQKSEPLQHLQPEHLGMLSEPLSPSS
jgi:hypothetical protein